MDLGAQLLELFLVRHAEMLLLVDNDEPEVLELDRLAEQRMGADHDVDMALGEPFLGLGEFGGRDEARRLGDVDRIAFEPLGKGLHVLARQERRRHHDSDLLAVHGRHKGRAQSHLGLAEADIAADQAIHRTAGAEIGEDGADRGLLVVGLFVRKARGEFVVEAGLDGQSRRFAQLSLGGDLDQFTRDLADAVFHARLAHLPGGGAQPVKLDAGFFRSVARQQLDVFHRQEKLVASRIVDFQAVVRRARRFDRAQPDKAADAVIDMDDDIAGGEACHLGDEILRPLRLPARTHQALAENVFFGDQRDVGGLETGIDAEHGKADLMARQRQRLRPRRDRGEIEKPMFSENMLHALARARAPHRDDDALAGGLQPVDMLFHGVEDVGVRLAALGGEVVAGVGADVDHLGAALGRRKRRQPRQRRAVEPLAPLGFGKIEPIRRQRFIGRATRLPG